MNQILKKPHIYWILLIFIVYLALNFLFSGFYNTIKLILIYAGSVDWLKFGTSIILTLVIGFLVAVNTVTVFVKYKERQKCGEGITTAGIGAIGGFAVGICPLCVTGLFPLIFSVLGVSFSFASLPLGGIEIQVLVIIILLASLWMLRRNEG
ncbi:MAG: hypothetical protein AABW50_03110 [Nanoarchaeota archaeon]